MEKYGEKARTLSYEEKPRNSHKNVVLVKIHSVREAKGTIAFFKRDKVKPGAVRGGEFWIKLGKGQTGPERAEAILFATLGRRGWIGKKKGKEKGRMSPHCRRKEERVCRGGEFWLI